MYHKLLKSFPSFIKPSYEAVIHKKGLEEYDIQVAIPYGKRSFLWYTVFNEENVGCIIELTRTLTLQDNIHIFTKEAPCSLSLGTVLSGYLIDLDEDNTNKKIFLADDIFMYKGYEFGNPFPIPFQNKIDAFVDFFKTSTTFFQNYFIKSVVMVKNDGNEISSFWKENIGYLVKTIQYRKIKEIVPHLNHFVAKNTWISSKSVENEDIPLFETKNSIWTKQISKMPQWSLKLQNPVYKSKQLFWVKAETSYDVYYLYTRDKNLYMYAFIPDYETSVMMNNIFRKIPENQCLDKIEESDDDEVFQNISDNKYLQRKKLVLMECVFNWKFKKWIPLKIKSNSLGKNVLVLKDLVFTKHRA